MRKRATTIAAVEVEVTPTTGRRSLADNCRTEQTKHDWMADLQWPWSTYMALMSLFRTSQGTDVVTMADTCERGVLAREDAIDAW